MQKNSFMKYRLSFNNDRLTGKNARLKKYRPFCNLCANDAYVCENNLSINLY